MTTWLIRTETAELAARFLADGGIYMSPEDPGPGIPQDQVRDDPLRLLTPEAQKFARQQSLERQVRAFVKEMSPGDWVVVLDEETSSFHLGEILAGHQFDLAEPHPYVHYRAVDWFGKDVDPDRFGEEIVLLLSVSHHLSQIVVPEVVERVRELGAAERRRARAARLREEEGV